MVASPPSSAADTQRNFPWFCCWCCCYCCFAGIFGGLKFKKGTNIYIYMSTFSQKNLTFHVKAIAVPVSVSCLEVDSSIANRVL